jgi:hypothetical protein
LERTVVVKTIADNITAIIEAKGFALTEARKYTEALHAIVRVKKRLCPAAVGCRIADDLSRSIDTFGIAGIATKSAEVCDRIVYLRVRRPGRHHGRQSNKDE